jgi:hypothetical protein
MESNEKIPKGQIANFISDATAAALALKQASLVSGTNIKSVNGTSLLGSGDLVITSAAASKIKLASANGVNAATPLTISTYDGSGQSTHPSVVYIAGGFNGYTYWMAHTPYPNSDDTKENPSIMASNDKITWVTPAGLTNPIEPYPTDGTYLADTELVLGYDNKFYCYWRQFNPANTISYIYCKTSVDGVVWSSKTLVLQVNLTNDLVSPCIVKENGGYTLYAINATSAPNNSINKWTSLNPLDFSASAKVLCTVTGLYGTHNVWHLGVSIVNGQKYAILNTNYGTDIGGILEFGIIENDINFTFFEHSMLNSDTVVAWTQQRFYRATFLPSEVTESGVVWDIWYGGVSATNQWRIGFTQVSSYFANNTSFVADISRDFSISSSLKDTTVRFTDKVVTSKIVSLTDVLNQKIPVGFKMEIITYQKVVIDISKPSGIKLRNKTGFLPKMDTLNGKISLEKINLNEWHIEGDLEVGTIAFAFPTDNLLSVYKFDEASGPVLDSFGTNPATNFGATTDVAGFNNKAYSFNGSTNYVEIPNNPDFSFVTGSVDSAFSIRAIVNWTTLSNDTIIGKVGATGATREWLILYENGKLIFRLTGQQNSAINIQIEYSFTPALGTWFELIFTYDGSATKEGLKMYVNNLAVGTRTLTGVYTNMTASSSTIVIGKYANITSYSFQGLIDEISVWKRELTVAEVSGLNNGNSFITL